MILYYALGGGLGHATRARAFLRALEIEQNAVILSSCPFLPDERLTGNVQVIKISEFYNQNPAAFREFLRIVLDKYEIEKIFLDVFPLGITGEFAGFEFRKNLEINYVARLLKWKVYEHFLKNIQPPRFNKTFLLESLEAKHEEFVNKHSNCKIEFELNYPPADLSEDKKIYNNITKEKQPFWLIAHSGDEQEIRELISYADEMRRIEKADVNLILFSPRKLSLQSVPKFFVFNFYPVSVFFKHAERIFTACGFNAMRQTKDFRHKHYFIPFERRYDDQFERAKRRRAENLIK